MNVNVSDLTPDQVRNVVSQLVRTNPDAVAEATGATLGVGSAVAVYDAEAAAADAVMGTQVPGTDPHHHQGPVSVSAAALGFPPAPPAVEEPWNRYETGVAPTQPSLRRLPAASVARAAAAGGGRLKTGGRGKSGKETGSASWEDRFTQLALYKAQKGTCDVPVKEEPQLGRWVRTQRQQFRLRADGKPSTMNDERVELLESIAFDFKVNSGRRGGGPRARHRTWDEWLEELRTYRTQHGHCQVPQKDPSGLGLWVSKQRQNFKAWVAGQPSPMTRERVAALEELGFQFQSLIPPRTPWEERLEELRQYKSSRGNCRVRAGKHREGTFSSLGKWVDRQRQMYKLRAEGKKTALTEERVKRLEEVGFEWAVPRGKEPAKKTEADNAGSRPRGRPRKDQGADGAGQSERRTQKQKWNDRFAELKAHAEANGGSTNVRAGKRKEGLYSQLGKWCDHQRQLYRQRGDGKPSSMTDERVQALESIGFQWTLQQKVHDTSAPSSSGRSRAATLREREILKAQILKNGKKQSQKWYDNYEDLIAFKEEHNHSRVTAGKKKDGSYSQLGKWVDHQRQLYRSRELGKPSSLTDHRIAALNNVGFEWVVLRRSNGPVSETIASDLAQNAVQI